MGTTRIVFKPKSLLAFVVAVSLVAYLGGTAIGLDRLVAAAAPIFFGAAAVALSFILLSLWRNVGRRR